VIELDIPVEAAAKLIMSAGLIQPGAADAPKRLAALAEAALSGDPVDDAAVRAEIEPCFLEDGAARTDTIVLACTHYPLLLDRFERLAPWPVRWLDPAPAIARRVIELVGPATGETHGIRAPAVFTSGRASAPFAAALSSFGLTLAESPVVAAI